MKKLLYFVLIIFAFVSCKIETAPEQKKIDFSGVDSSIKPGDNFFDHVNKSWYDSAVIADDQVGVGAYRFLNIPQKKLLQSILEEVSAKEHYNGRIEQMVGDYFASGMDTLNINTRGFEPIRHLLDRIDSISNRSEIMSFVIDQLKIGDYSLVGSYVSPDDEDSSVNILHFVQTGLGLPDRDYYFKTDRAVVAIQQAYHRYIARLFDLVGTPQSMNHALSVYDIETKLAESSKTRTELRDVKANYNKLSVSDINNTYANIGWIDLLSEIGVDTDSVDIQQTAYYDQLNSMLETVPLEDWKNYLKANTLNNYAVVLSQEFQDAAFEYRKVIRGQSKQKPRAQIMAENTDRQLGMYLSQLYVKRHFNEESKQRALELVNNLTKAFEHRIEQLDWMSDSTKLKAKDKLHAITKKIGYPDVWRDYGEVNISRGSYFENVVNLSRTEFEFEIDKLNKPPDKTEWGTTPSTVTAYYNPPLNEIVFPAGILQDPYFDVNADDAINYGGIGMVIGHELTHAFDDQGSQFDKDGNVKNWWTDEDLTKFKAKTQQVIDRYSSFTVLDSLNLNGDLTLGENTADNGGIAIAYDAFKMTEQGQDTIKIDGYTPDQRFFLSVARIWRVKTRDEYLRNYVATDPHSPPMWRVNGPLMNFTPFYEAFNVQPGDKNYKSEEERIKIW